MMLFNHLVGTGKQYFRPYAFEGGCTGRSTGDSRRYHPGSTYPTIHKQCGVVQPQDKRGNSW
jgi:hypothetical protein